jgi:phosphohistidine swiveling domain-containing protein
MKGVFSDIQEVVWYRTARTDILYELLFLSRPIIKEIGDYYKIPFDSLRDYTINGLIDGKLERYDYEKFTCFGEFGVNYYFNEKIIDEEGHNDIDHVKGNIAFKGNVKGKVKIVLELKDLIKIEKGDILVTQMTVPSFISAMVKASAFVTDEGGITCHAAIIAREMKKPCVIGTRIATKVFKDGDIVEVDADNGVVRKVKNVRQKGRLN